LDVSYSIFQRLNPCQLLSAGVVKDQPAPKGFRVRRGVPCKRPRHSCSGRGVLGAGHAEEKGELKTINRTAGSWQMVLMLTFSCSRISRQASAIDSATPLGVAHQRVAKALPWGRFVSDMNDVSVRERECF